MTMQSMVDYLEARGFKAIKEYVPKTRSYRFEIERNGKHLIKHFTYQYGPQSWRFQEMFLEDMVNEFEKYEKKEKEKEMANNIEWKVKNMTLTRTCTPYDPPHFDVELEGVIKGPISGSLIDITGELQKKLNAPDRKDGMDAWVYYMMAGGRQNGKTLMQFKMYAKMLGIDLGSKLPAIQKVIFNNPATIVIWADDTKTVVKAQNDELFDPEKGLAMAITKKALGNEGNYFDVIKKHVTEYQDSVPVKKLTVDICVDAGANNAFKEAADKLKKFADSLIEKKKEDLEHSKKWAAYQRLHNALGDKKATKADLIAAMEEAIGYLGEALD